MLQNKRIFVIEDNIDNRVVYHLIFVKQGILFEFDRWGTSTVSKLKSFSPIDLIIVDLMLPNGITGFNIFSEIRGESLFDYVPVIAVSASDPSIVIPKVRDLGFSGFIAKPIDYQQFPKQLEQVLNGESIWYDG
jgi:two-component system, cell cycle response regulator DivK